MSEVPIKHFWTKPTVALDFTSLTNRLTELRATVYTLTRERDAAVQDAAHQLDLRYAANRELVALQRETDVLKAELAKGPMPDDASMKSGDRVATGTGDERRQLTLAEAEAGGLPERMTTDEWAAMHRASTGTPVTQWVECRSCKQMVHVDGLHSCWDEEARVAERGAAVNHAEQVVLTAAVALIEWYDEVHADTQKQRLRAAVAALKAAEVAS